MTSSEPPVREESERGGTCPSADVAELEADLARTRADLADTLDQLTAKLDVKAGVSSRVGRTAGRAAQVAGSVRDRAKGADGKPTGWAWAAGGGTVLAGALIVVAALRSRSFPRRTRRLPWGR